MFAHLRMIWVTVRDSLWFIPGIMTLLAGALAVILVIVEKNGIIPLDETSWVYGGGAEGARGVLGAIAGGLITVTGVVFSVTIVALQLASSQFTPRVLRNFTADRANQVVLGVFIATFTYTVLVLRTVRSDTSSITSFVPQLAVTVAIVLVLVSIGFLIFFINHVARSIQVSTIIDRITRSTLNDVDRIFPEQVGQPDEADVTEVFQREGDSTIVRTGKSGYLQAVDANTLFELGEGKDLVIRMQSKIGAFLFEGEGLAAVWPVVALDEETIQKIRRGFVVGPDRTPDQDIEYGIIEISDIAVKALSPGINDPTTAMRCIDRLGEILLALGNRNPPRARRTREGHIHFVARYTRFEEALSLSFDQIRHFGKDNAAVMVTLGNILMRLRELVPVHRYAALQSMIQDVQNETRRLTGNDGEVTPFSGSQTA